MLVDAHHPRLPRVVVDDVQGGELATRHLLELGHERIAFLGDSTDPRYGFVSSRQRLRRLLQRARGGGRPLSTASSASARTGAASPTG